MLEFLSGMFTMACAAISLFFALYWRKTRDRLFAVFALAFLLLVIERIVLAFVPPEQEGRHLIFLARLSAFVLIIIGVIDKNRPRAGRKAAVPAPEQPRGPGATSQAG